MIEEFMGKLTRHSEQSLRFLRFRLDFNEYYSSTAGTPGSTSLKTHRWRYRNYYATCLLL